MWNPRRYLFNLLGYSLAMMVLFTIGVSLFGIILSFLVAAFLPVGLAALTEGQKYAAMSQTQPDNVSVWRVSAAMAEAYLTILVVATAILAIGNGQFRADLGAASLFLLFVLYGGFTAAALIVIRIAYAFGVKLQLDAENNHTG
ncbi:MAG: ABZJ_00895 family protein [Pseudomonadota bacterium]